MDSLDLRLLRAMFRGNVFSAHGFDPRLSVQEISDRVGASRVTVRRRLERWREDGFWNRVVAFPNPDALGTSFKMQAVQLDEGRGRSRSEDALIDILEPAFLFQVDDVYTPLLLAGTPAVSVRRQQRLSEVAGVHILCPPIEFPFVRSSVGLGLRDWSIIRSLHQFPSLDWQAVAEDVGVTVRGLQRRVAQLMDGGALFFFPELDFRRSPGSVAWVGILFGVGVHPAEVEAEMVRRFPDLLRVDPVFPFENMIPPSGRAPIGGRFPFFLPVPSASSGDQLRRDLAKLPGVVDVIVGFPTRDVSLPSAFAGRIAAAIDRLKASS